jgi:hypothetical protein
MFAKNSSWQAKQSILHTTVTFYDNCVKMFEDFATNFDDKRSGCCITTTHSLTISFLRRDRFSKSNVTVLPHPRYFSLFPRLKIKLNGRHFYTTEVMEAESQAVLNTLAENTASKLQKRWERCIRPEWVYFEGDGGQ